jgi:hypothetical protein
MLLNYNISPWLTTKKFFIMLALLIPEKQSVTSKVFDVYLEPLVAYNVLKDLGSRAFKLRAMLYERSMIFRDMGLLQVLPIKAMLHVRFVDRISKVNTQLNLESKLTRTQGGGYHLTTHGGPRQ